MFTLLQTLTQICVYFDVQQFQFKRISKKGLWKSQPCKAERMGVQMFQHSGHCQYQTAMTLDLCQKIIKVIQPEKTAGLLEELQPFRVRSAPEMLTNTNVREWKETRASQPLMSISIFLFPVFGSTPSRPVLYLPCPCSDREIHTWRTLSVGYCMFISRHQRIHSVPHCDSHLTFPG